MVEGEGKPQALVEPGLRLRVLRADVHAEIAEILVERRRLAQGGLRRNRLEGCRFRLREDDGLHECGLQARARAAGAAVVGEQRVPGVVGGGYGVVSEKSGGGDAGGRQANRDAADAGFGKKAHGSSQKVNARTGVPGWSCCQQYACRLELPHIQAAFGKASPGNFAPRIAAATASTAAGRSKLSRQARATLRVGTGVAKGNSFTSFEP